MIKLLLGNCLERMKEIPNNSVDMVLCDLPYGTTACKWDVVIPFAPLWSEYGRVCKGAIVLTASQPFTSALVMSKPKAFKYETIWEKDKPSDFGVAAFRTMKFHENILVFSFGSMTYNPQMEIGHPNHSAGKGLRKKVSFSEAGCGPKMAIVTNKTDGLKHPRSIKFFNREPRPLHPPKNPWP